MALPTTRTTPRSSTQSLPRRKMLEVRHRCRQRKVRDVSAAVQLENDQVFEQNLTFGPLGPWSVENAVGGFNTRVRGEPLLGLSNGAVVAPFAGKYTFQLDVGARAAGAFAGPVTIAVVRTRAEATPQLVLSNALAISPPFGSVQMGSIMLTTQVYLRRGDTLSPLIQNLSNDILVMRVETRWSVRLDVRSSRGIGATDSPPPTVSSRKTRTTTSPSAQIRTETKSIIFRRMPSTVSPWTSRLKKTRHTSMLAAKHASSRKRKTLDVGLLLEAW